MPINICPRTLFKRHEKWTPSESVTSRTMPRFGLRGVIFVPLLLLLSTNPPFVAAEGLQTNETKPELLPQADEELESWKKKSATIIHHLPGALLTTSRRGKFTMKFLNHLETKTMKNEIKETIRTTKFGNFLNLPKIKAMKNKIKEMVRTKKTWQPLQTSQPPDVESVQQNCKSKFEANEARDGQTAYERASPENVFESECAVHIQGRTKQENQSFEQALLQSDQEVHHGYRGKKRF